jgi:hypothetical protein
MRAFCFPDSNFPMQLFICLTVSPAYISLCTAGGWLDPPQWRVCWVNICSIVYALPQDMLVLTHQLAKISTRLDQPLAALNISDVCMCAAAGYAGADAPAEATGGLHMFAFCFPDINFLIQVFVSLNLPSSYSLCTAGVRFDPAASCVGCVG